jgi:regulator of nucleoside diphosphate kinase
LPRNKTQLEQELKHAKILPAKTIPEQVVGINTNVQVRDVDTAEELTFELVAPSEAKIKNNKVSILSAIGLALVGYETGDQVSWEFPEGLKTYKIEKVFAV